MSYWFFLSGTLVQIQKKKGLCRNSPVPLQARDWGYDRRCRFPVRPQE